MFLESFKIFWDVLTFSGILLGILQDSLGFFEVFWDFPWDTSRFSGIFVDFFGILRVLTGFMVKFRRLLGFIGDGWFHCGFLGFFRGIFQVSQVYLGPHSSL